MSIPSVTPDQFQYIKLPDGSYGKFRSDATDDQIRSAVAKAYPDTLRPSLNTVAKPNVEMQQTSLSGTPVTTKNPTASLPGGTPGQVGRPASNAEVGIGAAGLGAGALAAGGVPMLRALAPIAASEGIRLARQSPIGRIIPPGAELLPFLFGGKGEAAEEGTAAESEAASPEGPAQERTISEPPAGRIAEKYKAPIPGVKVRPSIERIAPEPIPGVETRPSIERIQAAPSGGALGRIAQLPPPEPGIMDTSVRPSIERLNPDAPGGLERRGAPDASFHGPERRALAPENQGFDFRPAEDLGNKVRADVEKVKGPLQRGSKALRQSSVLGSIQPAEGPLSRIDTTNLNERFRPFLEQVQREQAAPVAVEEPPATQDLTPALERYLQQVRSGGRPTMEAPPRESLDEFNARLSRIADAKKQ